MRQPDAENSQSNHRTQVLENLVEGIQARDRYANWLAEPCPVVIRPGVHMGECVPEQVSRNSQQNRADDQREPRRSAKSEIMEMVGQSAPDRVRQQSRHRELNEIVEEPERDERDRQSQEDSPRQRVPEPAVGRKAKKILEIGCEGTDQHSRGYQAKTSERERSGPVR